MSNFKDVVAKINHRACAKFTIRGIVGSASFTVIKTVVDKIVEPEDMEPAEAVVYNTGLVGLGFAVQEAVGESTDTIVDATFDAVGAIKKNTTIKEDGTVIIEKKSTK